MGSSHKVATVKQLGADHVIDKSKTDWIREVERMNVNGGEGFDVVFDANGVCPSLLSSLLVLFLFFFFTRPFHLSANFVTGGDVGQKL